MPTALGGVPKAMLAAMFSARAVLPMDGRAAITTISPGRRPVIKRSISVYPVDNPNASWSPFCSFSR
jgi:hypothetical protein